MQTSGRFEWKSASSSWSVLSTVPIRKLQAAKRSVALLLIYGLGSWALGSRGLDFRNLLREANLAPRHPDASMGHSPGFRTSIWKCQWQGVVHHIVCPCIELLCLWHSAHTGPHHITHSIAFAFPLALTCIVRAGAIPDQDDAAVY